MQSDSCEMPVEVWTGGTGASSLHKDLCAHALPLQSLSFVLSGSVRHGQWALQGLSAALNDNVPSLISFNTTNVYLYFSAALMRRRRGIGLKHA